MRKIWGVVLVWAAFKNYLFIEKQRPLARLLKRLQTKGKGHWPVPPPPSYVYHCAEGESSTLDLFISFSISITSDDIFYEVVTENNLVCTKKKASSYAGILFDHTLQNNCINQPCNSQYLLHSVNDTYFIYYIIIWTFIMNDCQWNIINIRETRACTITCTVELLTFVHSLYQGIKGNAITQFMILYWFA